MFIIWTIRFMKELVYQRWQHFLKMLGKWYRISKTWSLVRMQYYLLRILEQVIKSYFIPVILKTLYLNILVRTNNNTELWYKVIFFAKHLTTHLKSSKLNHIRSLSIWPRLNCWKIILKYMKNNFTQTTMLGCTIVSLFTENKKKMIIFTFVFI